VSLRNPGLFVLGTIVSLAAAILIEAFLALTIIEGLGVICTPQAIVGGAVLALIAPIALYSYSKSALHARAAMIYIAPIGVALGLWALLLVITNSSCPHHPLALLSFAYIIEAIVAHRLRLDFYRYSKKGSELFFYGIIIFSLGLLLSNKYSQLLIIGLLGNTIKTAGLLILTPRVIKRSKVEPQEALGG